MPRPAQAKPRRRGPCQRRCQLFSVNSVRPSVRRCARKAAAAASARAPARPASARGRRRRATGAERCPESGVTPATPSDTGAPRFLPSVRPSFRRCRPAPAAPRRPAPPRLRAAASARYKCARRAAQRHSFLSSARGDLCASDTLALPTPQHHEGDRCRSPRAGGGCRCADQLRCLLRPRRQLRPAARRQQRPRQHRARALPHVAHQPRHQRRRRGRFRVRLRAPRLPRSLNLYGHFQSLVGRNIPRPTVKTNFGRFF